MLELLERSSRALIVPRDIALNATGGTKPMSIAAYEAFRAYELPIFYIHPEHDRLIWLHPRTAPRSTSPTGCGSTPSCSRMARVWRLRRNRPIPASRQALNDWLVANVQRLAQPLGTLNWLANRRRADLVSPELERPQLRTRTWAN